jgi:hypothetical protein
MRGGADPLLPISAESVLAHNPMGGNTGNFLYLSSMHKTLSTPDTEIVVDGYWSEVHDATDAYVDVINNEFDHFVLPLANSFRNHFRLKVERLADLVSRVKIPVTIAGVGSQEALDVEAQKDSPKIDKATKRLVAAVLDRSASIGVRGYRTAEYLKRLGFGDAHIDVIGCPSMYQRGRDLKVHKKVPHLDSQSRFSINATEGRAMSGMINGLAERYPNMVYTAQDRNTLALLLWGQPHQLAFEPGIPSSIDDRLYREDRIRYFLSSRSWIDYMAGQEFSFGSRIHGNLSAVLGGTPAMVLAHDSRTLELADFFDIPHRELRSVPDDIDVDELYAEADFTAFNANQPKRFDNFVAFLERNGLAHIHQPGKANPEYEARLAAVQYPDAPKSLLVEDEESWRLNVVSRLAWLRQDTVADSARRAFAFEKGFPPPAVKAESDRSVKGQVARLTQRLDEQAKLLEKQRKEIAALKSRGPSGFVRTSARRAKTLVKRVLPAANAVRGS